VNSDRWGGAITFLFTDIEGSTRLWEQEPVRMRSALACHDALTRAAVADHGGKVVKMTGDGVYAAFEDASNAVTAVLELQHGLSDPAATAGIALALRCGLHLGVVERRDNDFFGGAVNRAARIMGAAHGGQILLSQAVIAAVHDRLPPAIALRDLGVVRLRDLATPEHVFQLVAPQLRQEFPALRSLAATPNNLPQQLTSLIGRERELIEVQQLLDSAPVLTLLGVGGLGKTRLALQTGAEVLDRFPDGVWFVELAPLSDERLVPQAVATVLGVKEEAGRALADTLALHVADRQMLLVLDNCEHLLQASARLTRQLLQASRSLKVLATSREPLHIAGETTYPVPTLAIPGPQRIFAPEALTEFASVRLFLDRAAAVQPAFRITHGNAAAVATLCQRLDGIPLALELAAARMRSLPVETIAARLQDRLRLLTKGDQTALPRQQTLRASIDWSYDLLAQRERAVFRRLAVFAGGWSLDAAEAVGAGDDIDASDVIDLMTQLVEKSLVLLDPAAGRYRMLETVRQYAQEKLAESGEENTTRMQHLAFYVAFLEEAMQKLQGPQQGAWLAAIDLDHQNILLAAASCDRVEGGTESGLRLVCAAQLYWLRSGLLGLGYRIAAEALARPGAQQRNITRGRALYVSANIGYYIGGRPEVLGQLEESLAIGRELGNTRGVAQVLALLGSVKLELGDPVAARGHLMESIALTRELPDRTWLATGLIALAEIHRSEGNLDAAQPIYEETLALLREAGDHSNTGVVLVNLAVVAIGRVQANHARRFLSEALAIAREINSKYLGVCVVSTCPGLATLLREWERATRLFGASERQMEVIAMRLEPVDEAFLAPRIEEARAALGPAAFAAALAIGRAKSYDEAVAEARAWLDDTEMA